MDTNTRISSSSHSFSRHILAVNLRFGSITGHAASRGFLRQNWSMVSVIVLPSSSASMGTEQGVI
jgi:hypothetical protein